MRFWDFLVQEREIPGHEASTSLSPDDQPDEMVSVFSSTAGADAVADRVACSPRLKHELLIDYPDNRVFVEVLRNYKPVMQPAYHTSHPMLGL